MLGTHYHENVLSPPWSKWIPNMLQIREIIETCKTRDCLVVKFCGKDDIIELDSLVQVVVNLMDRSPCIPDIVDIELVFIYQCKMIEVVQSPDCRDLVKTEILFMYLA